MAAGAIHAMPRVLAVFRLRAEVERAEAEKISPIKKARRILAVARTARKGAVVLAKLGIDMYAQGDRLAALRCVRASRRLSRFDVEAKNRARKALAG